MVETKKTTTPVNPWDTPKETWQFVPIPPEDLTGQPFPSIWLNKMEFKPGTTHNVPVAVAQYLNDRIRAFNKSVTRLFNPRADIEALRDIGNRFTPVGVSEHVDATQIKTL